MIIIQNIRDFIQHLTKKEMTKWSLIYVGLCASIMIGLTVRHIMLDKDLNQKMQQLNKVRQQVQRIFTEFNFIQIQKNKIDDLLQKNKNFNIQKYVQELMTQLNLSTQTTSRFDSEKLANGYTQENLLVNISSITTEQLCNLLSKIEEQSLVIILFLDINNMPQSKKINISIKLATLRFED